MQTVVAFLALILPLSLSPGPATIALAGLGMSRGIANSLPFYFGIVASAFAIAFACGMGLNEVLFSNKTVYNAMRYAGIAYIVYLAVKFIRARPTAVIAGSAFFWLAASASMRPLLKSERALHIQTVVFGVPLLVIAAYMPIDGA